MLRPGWMNRYCRRSRCRRCRTSAWIFGYVWAGLMFVSAALNIVLALTPRPDHLGGRQCRSGAIGSKVGCS